jgi:hypothetical protein
MKGIFRALVVLVFVLGIFAGTRAWLRAGRADGVTFYDANPQHLWNRLHAAIYIREDIPSTAQVADALDPPLWQNTQYLLSKPSHERIVRLLDEFLRTHGERLIQDPVQRAMLQRDLWAVFDWSAMREPERPEEPAYEKEKRELQTRLAETMGRLALRPEEIRRLPATYELAVKSGEFAKEYDPQHRERAFLPPDLFDVDSPWVQIGTQGIGPEPAAASHAEQFSRSSFLIFIRLPEGRKATYDYLHTVWDFPQPWVVRTDGGADVRNQTSENQQLPQFPAGTEVLLLRQMMLFDNQGTPQSTPITESVQIRVYRSVPAHAEIINDESQAFKKSLQDFYEIVLSRPVLFAGSAAQRSGGLRATGRKEKQFSLLNSFGADEGPPGQFAKLDNYPPALESCAMCHRGAGINSVNSRRVLLKPYWLTHDYAERPGYTPPPTQWWDYDQGVSWKQQRYEWGLLNGYWKAAAQ